MIKKAITIFLVIFLLMWIRVNYFPSKRTVIPTSGTCGTGIGGVIDDGVFI